MKFNLRVDRSILDVVRVNLNRVGRNEACTPQRVTHLSVSPSVVDNSHRTVG